MIPLADDDALNKAWGEWRKARDSASDDWQRAALNDLRISVLRAMEDMGYRVAWDGDPNSTMM